MKTSSKILFICIAFIMGMITVIYYPYEKPTEVQQSEEDSNASQWAFEQNLISFAPNIEEAFVQLLFLKGDELTETGTSISFVKIFPNQNLEYFSETDWYVGKISDTIYGFCTFLEHPTLGLLTEVILPCGEITPLEKFHAKYMPIDIFPFEEYLWYQELQPILKKYSLNVSIPFDWGNILVSDYEEFLQYEKSQLKFHVWGPKYIVRYYPRTVKFNDSEFFLIGQDGEWWLTREDEESRKNFEELLHNYILDLQQNLNLRSRQLDSLNSNPFDPGPGYDPRWENLDGLIPDE